MSETRECPFCTASLGHTLHAEQLSPGALLLVAANNPWWRPETGLCDECARGFESALGYVMGHAAGFAHGGVPILPTPVRLSAPEGLSGRGATRASTRIPTSFARAAASWRTWTSTIQARACAISRSPTCRAGTA
jgi:hypothetical protein